MARRRRTQLDAPNTAPADTLTTLTVEGTEYRATAEGLGRLKAPHWFHAAVLRHPPLPRAPRAHVDTSVEAWVARVSADIRKGAAKRGEQCKAYEGRPVGHGYVIVTTDGHRALCRKDASAPTVVAAATNIAARTSSEFWFEDSVDLALALRRMQAAGRAKDPTTVIEVDAKRQRVTLTTEDKAAGVTAGEWVPVTGRLRASQKPVAFDTRYLLDVLGLPGLRISLPMISDKAAEKLGAQPVMLETPDQEYRVLIMPKGGVTKALHSTAWSRVVSKPAAQSAPPVAQRLPRPARVRPQVPTVPAIAAGSVTVAPAPDSSTLTAGQKAARTRQARIAAGAATPVDWAAAGRKAAETRRRRLAERASEAA